MRNKDYARPVRFLLVVTALLICSYTSKAQSQKYYYWEASISYSEDGTMTVEDGDGKTCNCVYFTGNGKACKMIDTRYSNDIYELTFEKKEANGEIYGFKKYPDRKLFVCDRYIQERHYLYGHMFYAAQYNLKGGTIPSDK